MFFFFLIKSTSKPSIYVYMSNLLHVYCRWNLGLAKNEKINKQLPSCPGLNPGTVVITDKAVDYSFCPQFEQVVLGKVITRSTELDEEVASELLQYASELQSFPTVIGKTMCTHDFYEGTEKKTVFNFSPIWE